MRPGYALYNHRFAPFSARSAATTAAEIAHLIAGRMSVLVAAIFFALVLAAQAQESVDALPAWSEPTLPSSEPAPSTEAASLPSASEQLPSTPAEPLSSSSAPLPSSEEAFPSSSDPWSSSGNYYFAIEPQLTLGFGDIQGRSRSYLRLDYMPSGLLYVNHSDEDAFNQMIHLEGGYSTGRLRLSLYQDVILLQSANLNSFIDTTGLWANLDASAPTRMNIFNTRARAEYDLTGKLYLQGEFDSYTYFYPNNLSDYTVSGGLYLYYRWLPKVSVGVGGTFGYNWVDDPTPNQAFEQVNLRLNYEVTAKMALYASGGVEFRQFDGDRSTYVTPVFELGLSYYPFEGTTFTLAAGRRIYNSGYEPGQDFTNTYVVGRFQQRLFHRVYLGLAVGYENADYFAADDNVNAPRNDDYWFIEPSLDVLITRWLSAGVYYLHREDSSNAEFFSFDDNQVGVRATVRF